MRRNLLRKTLDKPEEEEVRGTEEILREIVARYSDEIAGDFQIPTYRFIREFLTAAFTRLLNTAAGRNWYRLWGTHFRLQDRIKIQGHIEEIRSLATRGTVVLLPTHFSNLDSILVGWAIDAIGLPAFSYGAGLNLFNYSLMSFFMNRLGAYKVDRRKKNLIYLETLKAYSQITIERGTHSLFFPGGTRERSGSIEKRLKIGLLGSVIAAQVAQYAGKAHKNKSTARGSTNSKMQGQEGATEPQKVFVVPLVLSYNFVLEAEGLIEEHLRRTGREMYLVEKDDKPGIWKTAAFIWRFFSESAEIEISFGKPMDVLGNFVDGEGVSYDPKGTKVDLEEYFLTNGEVAPDAQRDAEYTKILSEKLVDRYRRENIVLSSHVVAFTAFNTIRTLHPNLDLYGILRLPEHETEISAARFEANIAALQARLREYAADGKLQLAPEINLPPAELIAYGMKYLGTFHPSKPLRRETSSSKGNYVYSESLKLLLYYHNRLTGYSLENAVAW